MKSSSNDGKLEALITAYRTHHQNPRNQLIHYLCVPAIVFSVIGLLVAINFGVTLIAIAAAILYYNCFGQPIAMQMGAILIVMMVVWLAIMPSHHLPIIAIGIFILAWTGQFAGHIYEGSKPSFVEDVQSLMIGPLYVLAALKQKLARNQHLDRSTP